MERIFAPRSLWEKRILRWSRPSLKRRVRMAFLTVLLVVTPLLVLSISYSTRLLEQAHNLDLENERFEAIDTLRTLLDANIGSDRPLDRDLLPLLEVLQGTGLDVSHVLAQLHEHERQRIDELACETQRQAANPWIGSLLLSLSPCLQTRWQEGSRQALLQLRLECSARLGQARLQMAALADDATRNLVTLLILTTLVVAYFTVRFPQRLLQPLTRITHAVKMAEGGRLDVRAPLTNLEELDSLAQSFNNTMASIDDFDGKKRNRILTDRNKLDYLVTQLPDAAAILDITSALDVTNLGFREVFGLGQEWRGRRLTDLVAEGAAPLRLALHHLASTQEPLSIPFVLERKGSVYRATAEIVPILGANSEVAASVLVLKGLHQTEN